MKKKVIGSFIGVVLSILMIGVGVSYNEQPLTMEAPQNFMNKEEMAPPQQQTQQKPDNQPQDMPQPQGMPMNNNRQKQGVSMLSIGLIGGGSLIGATCIMYLSMSHFGKKKAFVNKDKIMIYALSSVLLTEVIFGGAYIIKKQSNYFVEEEKSEKEDVDLNGNDVHTSFIRLDEYNENILINEGGTYTLTGSLEHSVIIDAENQDVILVFNGVTIKSDQTAAIVGKNQKTLTIQLEDKTTNTLSDGGNSEYDACIYSASDLIIEGNGTLIVDGCQNEGEGIATEDANITIHSGNIQIRANDDGLNAGGDQGGTITINDGQIYIDASGDGIDSNKDAIINGGTIFVMGSEQGGNAGIDTDAGYQINGGKIIALGTDMIEKPMSSSKQKSISLTLNTIIEKNTNITLTAQDQEVISFQASKAFKTLIISLPSLEEGSYQLLTQTTHTGDLINGIYGDGTYSQGQDLGIQIHL
jgi:hypothetical protein